ncbi:thioesterase II family protein [Nonomuraea sp. H19]|uniref:thioesterase II family protein n=1 Tax=Nonomuraea sp. H19 TaxID=3452206 RepID=UPI003F8B0150
MNLRSLRCFTRRYAPRVRLVCFPHAGGAASFFRSWPVGLPADVEVWAVQYPGHEDRITEPCAGDMDHLAGDIAADLRPLSDRPIALFGHSLGAVVAYEVARLLGDAVHLFASARHAPAETVPGDVHLRDDDAVIDELVRLGGTDGTLLREPEPRSVFVPAIRADFRLAETYRHRPGPHLGCPITALIGRDDPEVTSAQAERWRVHTGHRFALRELPGDHFYLIPQRQTLLALLASELMSDAYAD